MVGHWQMTDHLSQSRLLRPNDLASLFRIGHSKWSTIFFNFLEPEVFRNGRKFLASSIPIHGQSVL